MGSALSSVKDAAKAQSAEAEAQANDALNSLLDIAEMRRELFLKTIEATTDPFVIPIHKTILSTQTTQANFSTDSTIIAKAVDGIIGDILNEDWKAAISGTLSTALNTLLGSTTANSSSSRSYSIAVSQNGGVLRLDYDLYVYQFTSQGMIELSKSVLAATVVLSSVVLKGLDANDVRVIVDTGYPDSSQEERAAMIAMLIKEVQA